MRGCVMRPILCALVLAGCGGAELEPWAQQEQALQSEAWQNLFAIRATGEVYTLNPLGSASVYCPTTRSNQYECTMTKVSFAALGLADAQVQQLKARLQSESADERLISVVVKGRYQTRYALPPVTQFSVEAAYWAPSVRVHAPATWYVAGSLSLKPVNGDFSGLSTLTLPARTVWVGPAAERPASFPSDSLVSVAAMQNLGGPGHFGPFEARVDQLFRRITP